MTLKGKQHKLDKNKDGKISGADFKMMNIGGEVLEESGKTISNADKNRVMQIINSIKNKPKMNLMDVLGESGKTISDADRERIGKIIGAIKSSPQKFKKGGEVEAKPKKTISKKKTSMTSRGAGAAIRGTKFVGVR
jgi:hypothetical protein